MRNRKHDIERYLRGDLSPNEMHALEKEALNDPFLAEALEGVEQAGTDNFLYDLHKLNRTIHDRARRTTRKNNKGIRMWGWASAVAATVLLVAVSGFLVINLLTNQRQREQSMNKSAAPDSDTTERDQPADSPTVAPDSRPPIAALEPEKSAINKDEHAPQRKPDQRNPPENPSRDRGGNEKKELPPQVDAVTEDDILAEDVNRGAAENTEREKVGHADESERQPALDQPSPAGDRTVSRALDSKASGAESSRKKRDETHLAPASNTMVKGKVTDEAGQVLPGVNVIVQGTGTGAVTDGEGNYEIAVPDDGAKLVFAFIGYESKEIEVREEPEVNVTLEGDIATLSEVVVTGYGYSKDREEPASFRFAEPNGGRSDFKGYLAHAVKYPQEAIRTKTEGKVTVRFTVEPTGQLTDFEVVKGIGSGCEEELIRAIRQGPYWKPSTRGDEPVRDQVKVRYRFDLPK